MYTIEHTRRPHKLSTPFRDMYIDTHKVSATLLFTFLLAMPKVLRYGCCKQQPWQLVQFGGQAKSALGVCSVENNQKITKVTQHFPRHCLIFGFYFDCWCRRQASPSNLDNQASMQCQHQRNLKREDIHTIA